MDAVIELDNVSLIRNGKPILKDVSLSFFPGQCTIVMGFSGSGASSLLKTAAGIIPSDKGRVLAYGQNIEDLSSREQFQFRDSTGFVFQDAALWANMSGFQNIALPLQFHRRKMSQDDISAHIDSLVKEFEFTKDLSLRPVDFSTGERKILSFIRAMILEPAILFLDDPTAAIDNSSVKRILRILKKRKERGCTLIIATYNPTYAVQLGDNFVILREGNVTEQGSFEKVRSSADPYVMEVLSESFSAAVQAGDLLNLLAAGKAPADP
jgi:phospholipid/cholesterol/gamma-HCH transport system ATP-binding protein